MAQKISKTNTFANNRQKSTRKQAGNKIPGPTAIPGGVTPISDILTQSNLRMQFRTLSKMIDSKPPLDRHPAVKLGDFLPDWFAKNVARPSGLLTDAVEVWMAELPAQLAAASSLVGVHRGSLLVYVQSAAAKAEIDSILRSHLLGKIQIRTRGTIQRVKTVVHHNKS